MQVAKFGAAMAGVMMLLAQSVMAADDSTPIAGVWVDKLPSGMLKLIEFTPTTVAFYDVDPASGRGSPPTTMTVTYKKDDQGAIRLTPTTADGLPFTVTVKNADTAVLKFDGYDARTLTRQKAPAMPKGHGVPKPDASKI